MKKKMNVKTRVAAMATRVVAWIYGMVQGFLLRRAIRKADRRARGERVTLFVLLDDRGYPTVLSWREIKACMTLRNLPRMPKEWYKKNAAYWVNGWCLK